MRQLLPTFSWKIINCIISIMCGYIKALFSNIHMCFQWLFEVATMRVKPENPDADHYRPIPKLER